MKVDFPHLVVIAGPPCSGKSTLANALANDFDATVIDPDTVLSEIKPGSNRNHRDRMISYEESHNRAKEELANGKQVILVCTYSRPEYRADLAAKMPEQEMTIVEVSISPDLAVERFRQRENHAGINNSEELVRQRSEDFPYSSIAIRIDGSLPTELQRDQLVEELATNHGDLGTWLAI